MDCISFTVHPRYRRQASRRRATASRPLSASKDPFSSVPQRHFVPNSGGQPLSGVPVLANPNETAGILVIGKPVHLSGMRSLRPSLSSRRSTSAHAAGYIQTSDGAGAPRISIAWPSCPSRSHKQPEPRGRAEGRGGSRAVACGAVCVSRKRAAAAARKEAGCGAAWSRRWGAGAAR